MDMTNDLNGFKQELMSLKNESRILDLKVTDIYSFNLLQTLINGYPVLPFTGSSLRPFCMAHVVNDIIINERKCIIEFGSGISTIILGRLLKKNNLTTTILSIDHNADWLKFLNKSKEINEIKDQVQLIHAPLKASNYSIDDMMWYDTTILSKETSGKVFDMVLIDGPSAYQPTIEKSRYPALPFVINKLACNSSIYLDDANRPGEKYILQEWGKHFPSIKFFIKGHTLACAHIGESFFTDPFSYYY
jgi:hypothetical protein